MSKYFIADLHFGDKKIIDYEDRPFKNIEDMQKKIIENWNKTVTEFDTVYVCGDVSNYENMSNKELIELNSLIHKLNGRKELILGNHDKGITYLNWKYIGFRRVHENPIIINDFFILSHEPLYTNKNMPYANIFGHVHNNSIYKDFSKQHYCVSVERIDYTPIKLEDILKKIKE